MSLSTSSAHVNTRGSHAPVDALLHGTWLLVARSVWAVVVVIDLVVFAAGLPALAAQLNIFCTAPARLSCVNLQLVPDQQGALRQAGLSLTEYAIGVFTLDVAVTLLFLVIGALIFWHKSAERMGLFVSLLLISFGCFGSTLEFVVALSVEHPDWVIAHIINEAALVFYPALGLFFCIFPTGRFVPRWSWLFIFPWVICLIPFAVPADSPLSAEQWPPVGWAAFILLTYGNGLGLQVYRYRYVSGLVERQQTKWFIFGFAVAIFLFLLYNILKEVVPAFNQPDSPYQLLDSLFIVFIFAAVALSIGLAILRYRLWEIDAIINKALVYGLLTALLAALYAGLIVGLEGLAGLITKQASDPLVLVVSTLAIAALFQPARRRIQALIDRRFYRQKYDAEQTLAAFSATLRNEVDLNDLHKQLIAVVQETMQPAYASLWLRQSEHLGNPPLSEGQNKTGEGAR